MIEQAAGRATGPQVALRNRTVVACSTPNSRTKETFSKFAAAIHTKTGARGPAVARGDSRGCARRRRMK